MTDLRPGLVPLLALLATVAVELPKKLTSRQKELFEELRTIEL